MQSLAIDDFYAGEGTDHSGVPTKMVTLNCSLNIAVYNPASMFGIHVTSGPIRLLYSEIAVGVGQVRKYYQPRKSHRVVTAVIHGEKTKTIRFSKKAYAVYKRPSCRDYWYCGCGFHGHSYKSYQKTDL